MNTADLPAIAADLQAATTGIGNVLHQWQQKASTNLWDTTITEGIAEEIAPYLDKLELIRQALVGSNQGQP